MGERGIDWFDRRWAEVMVGRGPIPSFRGQSHLGGQNLLEFRIFGLCMECLQRGWVFQIFGVSCCSYVWANANFGSPRAEAPT